MEGLSMVQEVELAEKVLSESSIRGRTALVSNWKENIGRIAFSFSALEDRPIGLLSEHGLLFCLATTMEKEVKWRQDLLPLEGEDVILRRFLRYIAGLFVVVSTSNTKTFIFAFTPSNGSLVSTFKFENSTAQVHPLGSSSLATRSTLGSVSYWNLGGDHIDDKTQSSICWIDVRRDAIVGTIMKGSDLNMLQRSQQWRVTIPGNRKVIAMTSSGQPVTVPVRSLGNRSVLHKYQNPNLIVVGMTGTENQTSFLEISLIDGATGSILASRSHVQAGEPVSVTQAENFVVYSFWSERENRQELHVLDLLSSGAHWMGETIAKALMGEHWIVPLYLGWIKPASLEPERLSNVLDTSFYASEPIVAMAVTSTKLGITAKSVLIGTSSGRVTPVSRFVLDPRRPRRTPDMTEQAEFLFPYYPHVPLVAIQGGQDPGVVGLRKILSFPAQERESTTHIFAIGVDVSYSQFAPAGKFDTLSVRSQMHLVSGTHD
uniref:ER membrane protein complex subunit 1 n=1 Tax=Compsopogon caeruleus TaxID=31354 RepID=A0A7S1TIK1_9RHOD|mmetsp:Transcript_9414/g.19274  ORF Transcript_9414/g.19274 Transcript_9414/m.19274 type:complete len:488 (+) Transcript_9414:1383-2846(+)